MDLSAIALQGLQQADVQVEQAATQIASSGGSSDGANLDVVDLSAEMVALMSAKNQVSLSLSVLSTANEIQKNLLNVTA